jgi:hypothetical protein
VVYEGKRLALDQSAALAPALAEGKNRTKRDWAIALVWALALALVVANAAA